MIGNNYWANGITLYCRYDREQGWLWKVSAGFHDAGVEVASDPAAGLVSTQGHLESRLWIPGGVQHSGVEAVVDTVKDDAERLGIRWQTPALWLEPNSGPHPPSRATGVSC